MCMNLTQELVNECRSYSELTRKLGKNPHSRITKKLKFELDKMKISHSHFTKNGSEKETKIEKVCPICKSNFLVGKKEQTTCSYSCSNVYFARKRNKPENYKNYRTICFKNHKKICVVCGEDKIVTVHHMDENHKNNDPKNLVPLCPTHHQYWHSRYRDLIREKVENYINGHMAKLADAQDLGSCGLLCGGSSPSMPTNLR